GGRRIANEHFGPAALPALERIHDAVMLAMRVVQQVVHLREIRLVEGERGRPRKRDTTVALERGGEERAARFLENERVKAPVHLGVDGLVALFDGPLYEELVAVVETVAQLTNEGFGGAALRHAPRGEALEHRAQIDGVGDVRGGEPAHDVA